MPKHLLPLIPAGLLVRQILPAPDRITVLTKPRPRSAGCPACGKPSRGLHSRYTRTLDDLPWQGRPVTIRVAARRFRCSNRACPRQTFAERLTGIASPAARRTERLRDLQRHLGLATGGEAGARLAQRLAMPTSPDTLLRLAGAAVADPASLDGPRVLGVDDWAWRRGHRYGTILVDLERNKVVDLLPDRQAETLAAWLRQDPAVEIVARDRAGAYADGIRQGAPEAVQVADRWHLLRNLGEAVRAVVDRHHAAARRAARQVAQDLAATAHTAAVAAVKPGAAEVRRRDAYARRQARYEEAARLRQAGVPLRRIAGLLGAERKTVRRWLHAGHAPLWRKPPRGSVLDPHRGYLERRWAKGCRNAAQLWRELVERGFVGRPTVARAWARRRRTAAPDGAGLPTTPTGSVWRPPCGHRVARLLMAEADALPAADRAFVTRLLAEAPELARAMAVARRQSRILRREGGEGLEDVLAAAEGTPLADFAAGLHKGIQAVQAALELPWTTSPVEGQISRLKMLKRTMYGRAGFQLLRQRVLHAA